MKKPIPKFLGNIVNQKLKLDDEDDFKKYLYTLQGRIEITVKPYKYKRSEKQNRFYWLYLNLISDDTGDDSNSLHEFFKYKLLPPIWIKAFGEEIETRKSTTKLDKQEFGDYIRRIEVLTGIQAPDIDLVE